MKVAKSPKRTIIFRLCLIGAILGASAMVVGLLFFTQQPPAKAERRERAIRVEVIEATAISVPVTMQGFGQVRARDVVSIAPEVAGRVVEVHPRLEVGEVIPEGEILFSIDDRDYQARLTDASATVEQLTNGLERLRKQYAIDQDRLKTYERSAEVSYSEFTRVKNLYETDQVGTQSNVDQAEMSFNAAKDAADRLRQAVTLYPDQIKEAEAALQAAQAREQLSEVNFERTRVVAPFSARVKAVNVEAGQYITPGAPVLTLADDSILEITVSLNSQDARRWLQFEHDPVLNGSAWFGAVKRVPVQIYWTEGSTDARWTGELHRIEKFDEATRTVDVAVRVSGEDVVSESESTMPLVEGMFCRVEIPGKVVENVYRIPVSAVGFDRDASGYRTAYIAQQSEDGEYRLHSVRVRENHIDSRYVYVSEGIQNGQLIVATRLVNPLERSLLSVSHDANQTETEQPS